MVSSLLVDALGGPTKALIELYTPASAPDFPAAVTKHFSDVFQADGAFHQIPVVDAEHAPEHFADRALVRFRAMVQDPSAGPELFLAALPDGRPGGWGIDIEPAPDAPAPPIDYEALRECTVLWAVDVPGESAWCARELDGDIDPSQPSGSATQIHKPHKFPAPSAHSIGMQLKIYDPALSESLRSTDCATFVGILTHEATTADADADPDGPVVELPTLHVLFVRPLSAGLVARPYPAPAVDDAVRDALLGWLADEALGGDRAAAEWVLLTSIARVQSRHPPLLPPTLTLSHFPPSSDAAASPALADALSLLLPLTSALPATLAALNTRSFAPASASEDLRAGALQLPPGTLVLLSEAGLAAGAVSARGLANVRAAQDALGAQTLQYAFPFSAFPFETDLGFVVLVPGRASAFFKTDVTAQVRPVAGADLYRPVQAPAPAVLATFRDLVLGARTARISVSAPTSEHIQADFVAERQAAKVSADDLVRRMAVAKLLAQSMHAPEVTVAHWERAKALDAARTAALE